MHPITHTNRITSSPSYNLPQPSISSGYTPPSKEDEIRARLRNLQCEPHEIADMRKDLISSGLPPARVYSIIYAFKKKIIKAKSIDNIKKNTFLSAIAELGKIGKQKNQPFPNISIDTITRIKNDPSDKNIRSLLSCMSRANIYITEVPLCLVILTTAKVNRCKIIASCYKYKRSIEKSVHLKTEEKESICNKIKIYLKQLSAKAPSDQPKDAREQIETIKNNLLSVPVTLEDLVTARYKLKMLGLTPVQIGGVMYKHKQTLQQSSMTQEEKERYIANINKSAHLVRVKIAEQIMLPPRHQSMLNEEEEEEEEDNDYKLSIVLSDDDDA